MTKLSGPVAAGIVVAAVIVVLIAGYLYVRHATGADFADQLHADMKKIPAGHAPISPAQIEELKRQKAAGTLPARSPHSP